MRRSAPLTAAESAALAASLGESRSDWGTLKRLLPYFWEYRVRMAAALLFLIGAKAASVGVPLLLKRLVDALSIRPDDPTWKNCIAGSRHASMATQKPGSASRRGAGRTASRI